MTKLRETMLAMAATAATAATSALVAAAPGADRGEQNEAVTGDAARGKALMESSACFDCHRIADRGSRLGPNLSTLGSRRTPVRLRQALVAPDEEVIADNRFVRIVTKQRDDDYGQAAQPGRDQRAADESEGRIEDRPFNQHPRVHDRRNRPDAVGAGQADRPAGRRHRQLSCLVEGKLKFSSSRPGIGDQGSGRTRPTKESRSPIPSRSPVGFQQEGTLVFQNLSPLTCPLA